MMLWQIVEGNDIEDLGLIPMFLDNDDTRPAREQIEANYCGGWNPFEGFTFDIETGNIEYEGDPPLAPFACMELHGKELILVYPHAWVLILQKDRSFEIARLD